LSAGIDSRNLVEVRPPMRAGRLSGLARADYALPPHAFAPLRSHGGDRDEVDGGLPRHAKGATNLRSRGAIGVNAESAI
jgi:hypothetical protein